MVVNDLFLSPNKGSISVLALIDFSMAFDTIDHPILVHRLHTDLGFTDSALQWFSSYLTDRTHYISLSNHCPVLAPAHSGVPLGSLLGPMHLTMWAKPLSAIIDSHSFFFFFFLRTSGRCNRQSEFTLLHFTIFHWFCVLLLRYLDNNLN